MTNDVDNPDELTSRVRKFAQERDKQLQRRYQNNNDKNKSTSNEKDSILSSHQGQFTPAIRQFSAPKGMTESYLK